MVLFAWHREATVVSQPGGRFEDPDAMFHARRVVRTIASRGWLPPVFDAFEDFPDGGRAVWPPLHDATLALFARLGGSTATEPEKGLLVAAAFPVLELVGVVLAAAALARRFGGVEGAAAAAWLAALSPVLARRGAFGEIDHNVTEVLGALLLALLAGLVGARLREGRRAFAGAMLFGAGVLLALGFFAGLALSAAVVAGGFLVRELVAPEEGKGISAVLAGGFALAGLALPPFASLRVTPDPGDPWRLGPVYVLVLAAAALVCGAVALAPLARARVRNPRADATDAQPQHEAFGLGLCHIALAALSALAALALFALEPSAARAGFLKGLGFVGSTDRWLSTIEEFRPVTTLDPIAAILPAAIVGLAAAAVALRLHAWRALPVFVPFLALLALALVQKRFLPLAAAFGAVAAGAVWPVARETRGARLAVATALVAGVLAAAPRVLSYVGLTLRAENVAETSAGELAGAMLRDLTPDPGDPPAWGVLAPWDYGHAILRNSGRAVALNNFGNFQPGFERALAIFLETSPRKAFDELTRLELRYVVAAYAPNVVPQAAFVLRRDARRFFADGFSLDRLPRYEATPEGERTLAVRLHLHDAAPLPGDSAEDRAALFHFRKLAESPEQAPGPGGAPVPFLKVFEVAP
jgi:hypothetical protein